MEAPPSPLSSRPERSVVERSAVSAVLAWKCFSTGGLMGLRPTQGNEKRVLFSNHTQWKRRLPFVISTGAHRSGEIGGVSVPCLEMFFDRRSHGPSAHPMQ